MLIHSFLAAFAAACPVLGAFHPSSHSRVVPGAFILKVAAPASGLAKRYNGVFDPAKSVATVFASVEDRGINYSVRHLFEDSAAIFHGASIKVPDGVTGDELAALEGVQDVWPVTVIPRPTTGSVSLENGGKGGKGSSSSFTTTTAQERLVKRAAVQSYASDTFYAHAASGVQKAHQDGHLGAGVKVALIDTGVDYKNPILGGCFGTGCHISFGYDFVGDDYDGSNDPEPDSDPYDNCENHGTATTGVIGALANSYGFSGVAPAATLGMYRVFGCTGSTTSDIVLAAYVQAVQEGAEVINLSFGSPGGFISSTPVELLIDEASKLGVVSVIAAGNYGGEGLFFSQQPASSFTGISVGSITPAFLPAYNATLNGGHDPIPYIAGTPVPDTTTSFKVYFTSTDSSIEDDACSVLPGTTPNLTNYITIVQRGTCAFTTKYANVAAAGGRVVFIYNDQAAVDILIPAFSGTGLDAAGALFRDAGLSLLKLYITSGSKLRMTFGEQALTPGVVNTLAGNVMDGDSNYGPTSDLYPAVTISAPGRQILTTVPISLGTVDVLYGSSFAAPFVAGAVAVLKAGRSAQRELTPGQIRDLLTTTASLVPVATGSSTYVSAALQGGGLIQLARASSAMSIISPSILALNDSSYLNATQTISFRNRNSHDVYYVVTASALQTLVTYADSGDILPATAPPSITAHGTTTIKGSRKILVHAGRTVKVRFTIKPPVLSADDVARFPVYSGLLLVSEQAVSGGRLFHYHVTYFGLAAKAFDMPVLDTTDIVNPGYTYPFLAGDDIQTEFATYTMPDGPFMIERQAGGSPLVTIDVVLASIDFTGTIPTNNNGPAARFGKRSGAVRSLASRHRRNKKMKRGTLARVLYSAVKTVGNIYTYVDSPRDFLVEFETDEPASDTEIQFNGTYTTPSGMTGTAEKGVKYRLLLRALKVTGDPKFEDQYESWLSPPFAFT